MPSRLRLTVNYRFGTRSSLLQPLLRGDLDFAIVGLEEDEFADELVCEPLLLDRNALVVRSSHPLLDPKAGGERIIADFPWLVLSECTMLRRRLRADGAPFTGSVIRTDSFHFFRATLVASECVGLTRY